MKARVYLLNLPLTNINARKMFYLTTLLVLVISSVALEVTEDELLITLPDGQVRGTLQVSGNNKKYYGFQAIPFAAPPLGELRFQAPIPPQPWSGILDGAKQSNSCIAAGPSLFPVAATSEDCLYINVYTPSLDPAEKLPVMFWIYGGAFSSGRADKTLNGPDFFIEEDVIIVTHNYRVGAFGFLSTGDTAIRGNAGLKDQVLALKWVQANIALFGGDPDKVTIFGESAGGQSTGLQTVTKLSVGLFRAAIVQSGSLLTNSSATIDQRSYAFELASKFSDGDYGNDTEKLKTFLQKKTADEINNAALSITGEDIHAWPTLEVEGEEAFLTESPYVLLQNGDYNKVPIMIGICAEESLLFIPDMATAQELALMLDTDRKKVIPLNLRPEPKDKEAVITKIRNMYLKENETFSSNFIALAEYISDNKFARALIKHAELHSYSAATYLYQFAYYGRAMVQPFIDGVEKASHAAELPFLFNMTVPYLYNSTNYDEELNTQRKIVNLWANFAKYLNPTPEKTELLDNVIWPITSSLNFQYLNINNTLEVRQGLKIDKFQEWNETYYAYGEKPFITF